MERVWIEGQLLGHEADFDEGLDAVFEQAVVDLVDVCEVVDRVAVLVFVVDAEFVMKDGVEADVAEVGDFLNGAKIVAIALAQREDGAARAEHLLPEMRKGCGARLRVDGHGLLRGGESREKQEETGAQNDSQHWAFPRVRSKGSICDLKIPRGLGPSCFQVQNVRAKARTLQTDSYPLH